MAAINKFVGKVFIDGLLGGWQEVFIMKAENVADAKTDLGAVITARAAMLSSEITIQYATVSDLGVKRDAYLALDGTQDGSNTATTWVPNRDSDTFLLRQETGAGKGVERHLHGVPDSCIVAARYVDTGAGGGYDTALDAYIAVLKDKTRYLKKTDPTDPTTWELVAWANIFRRSLSERKVGAFFDRLRGRRARV